MTAEHEADRLFVSHCLVSNESNSTIDSTLRDADMRQQSTAANQTLPYCSASVPVASASRSTTSFRLRTSSSARLCCICPRCASFCWVPDLFCQQSPCPLSGVQEKLQLLRLRAADPLRQLHGPLVPRMNAAPGGSRASSPGPPMPCLPCQALSGSRRHKPHLCHASLEPRRRSGSPVGKSLDHAIA